MSAAKPLTYAQRCERYARQRGWHYDEHRPSIGHLTPRQRRRAMRKERHAWPAYSRRAIDMPWDPRYRAAPPLPPAAEWNDAIAHSLANPDHILGPYEDDDGCQHMACDGSGDPYKPSNCNFDTAKQPAATREEP